MHTTIYFPFTRYILLIHIHLHYLARFHPLVYSILVCANREMGQEIRNIGIDSKTVHRCASRFLYSIHLFLQQYIYIYKCIHISIMQIFVYIWYTQTKIHMYIYFDNIHILIYLHKMLENNRNYMQTCILVE